MSKIAISGASTGTATFTIESPATSTNRTLTLPDNTGTIITQNSTPAFASTIGVGGATAAASGAGITFPATQSASSDANTLDDYEEGTWTPTLKEATNTLTAGTNGGYYTKIGNQVTVWINIQDINKSGSGDLSITGLPFSANTANDRFISGAIAFNRIDIPAGIGSPYVNIPNYNSLPTTLYLFWNTDGNTNAQQWTAADLADNTSADIAFTLTYFV